MTIVLPAWEFAQPLVNKRYTLRGWKADIEEPHREVRNEGGIVVENLRYFGSKLRPLLNFLMSGFKVNYAGGELRSEPTRMRTLANISQTTKGGLLEDPASPSP